MKVKSILKIVLSTEIEITVETEKERFKTYYINYLAENKGITYDGETAMNCDSSFYLPDEVLDRKVTFIDTNKKGSLEIKCYLK